MKDQDKKAVKSEQERIQDFIKEYELLCKGHGLHIVVNPVYKARDDGTFSTVLESSVVKLPMGQ